MDCQALLKESVLVRSEKTNEDSSTARPKIVPDAARKETRWPKWQAALWHRNGGAKRRAGKARNRDVASRCYDSNSNRSSCQPVRTANP